MTETPLQERNYLSIFLALILLLGSVAALGGSLWAGICSYSWLRNRLSDYGIYLNMMWNTAHGAPFRFLLEGSYLRVHLSFTVGLLGFAFRILDHPGLLVVLQWLCSLGGVVILLILARRFEVPLLPAAAVSFFYSGYRFVQALHVHQFHGVALYLICLPALYASLRLKSPWAWLWLILTLGIREDAFLISLPVLLFFAWQDRRWSPRIMALTAVLYGALAIFFLYPSINGISIWKKRAAEIPAFDELFAGFRSSLPRRLRAVFLVVLPLVAAGRYFPVAFFFPSVALGIALASKWPSQQGLGSHYAAGVAALMACGLTEAFIRARDWHSDHQGGALFNWGPSLWLALSTIAVHVESGFLPRGGKSDRKFYEFNKEVWAALGAAQKIPREGILITGDALIPLCGNRRDVLVWHVPKRVETYDHIFADIRELRSLEGGMIWEGLSRGEWGVLFNNGRYVILTRGFSAAANDEVLRPGWIYYVYGKRGHGGVDRVVDGFPVRYWEGDGSRAPINLAHGFSWPLPPGEYSFYLEYWAQSPRRIVKRHWGWFSLHERDRPEDIARAYIPLEPRRETSWQILRLDFTNTIERDVEIRLTGGDAPLWLYRVYWRKGRDGEKGDATCSRGEGETT